MIDVRPFERRSAREFRRHDDAGDARKTLGQKTQSGELQRAWERILRLPPMSERHDPTALRRGHGRMIRATALDTQEARPFCSDQTVRHPDRGTIVELPATLARDPATELSVFNSDLNVMEPTTLQTHLQLAARQSSVIHHTDHQPRG
jgi:hypothetical protein